MYDIIILVYVHTFMSRVKQFIQDHSDLPIQDIQQLLHSSEKVEKTNFDFLFQFLLFYFLKFK
ncbi:hypothetical protein [uncultured Mediterranean phage uvMED]|nr:hypothetical protein [uncultured Mediterranean phage uvMED]BAR21189.1 hypothetical protein [uncultured Mediterranean phage uvMED]BAR21270.1 hypothetical protein [uncultured Mediterranean phage uvMED]BAR21791.1 hypothetical protein [uncultured Mediterranean phage uvMED]BAR38628.1 hypothetical protein [uncultured Mediterranean phage uvMED]